MLTDIVENTDRWQAGDLTLASAEGEDLTVSPEPRRPAPERPVRPVIPLPRTATSPPTTTRPLEWQEDVPGAAQRPRRIWRVLRRLAAIFVVVQLIVFGFVASLGLWAPSRTAFMLEDGGRVTYQYVSLDHVSRYLIAAVIAHEDQQLGTRTGAFSFAAFRDRASAYLHRQPDPSGSTIPQQLAKNVFLWPGQDPLRKAIEAVVSTEMSLTLSPRRVLELYINYAQFGPHLYGICAATWYYFGEPPWDMTSYQAAQLMGVLPDPNRVTRAPAGGIDIGPTADPAAVNLVNGAANRHVPSELEHMGGWRAAVGTIGIDDTAAAHVSERTQRDACSTMPQAVSDLIAQQ